MIILKILQKGLYVEIPGTLPTRTPAEIDISKCNLSMVDMYLRKSGISNYQILSSVVDEPIKLKPPIMKDSSIDQQVINKRFSNLEKMLAQLVENQLVNKPKNSEQITDKLNKLEELSNKILKKKPEVVNQVVQVSNKKTNGKRFEDEPEIEELTSKFIPEIDITNMKMKGGAKKTIKQDKVDIDDSADLLSRIMGQGD